MNNYSLYARNYTKQAGEMYVHQLYGNSRLSTVSCLIVKPQVLYFSIQIDSDLVGFRSRFSTLQNIDQMIQRAAKDIWNQRFLSAMIDGSKEDDDLFVDFFLWTSVENYSDFMELVKRHNRSYESLTPLVTMGTI